jgi:tetratricopeptide (TPR) repeat protein
VPFDREGTLRKAEKLLRQGKLDLAIAEYRSVIEAEPSDWNTSNTLGDLYFRGGQTDKAVSEYSRIADHLANEGFLPKAVALYRKILKIKPDEERTQWSLGQISARQGLLVDARAHFTSVAERRRTRGDRRGEMEARIRLGELDGADLATRLTGARGKAEIGDVPAAVEQLKQIAADLREKGQDVEALKVLGEAVTFAPQDIELKREVMSAHVARGDFEAARQYAASSDELRGVAEELFTQGRDEEGLAVLKAAADADPADMAIRARLAKAYVARGDLDSAAKILTAEVAASDRDLLWVLAEIELRGGRIQEGTAVLQQLLEADPQKRDALVILGCSVGETNPDAGYECLEVAARAAIAQDEWGSAAAALNEFVHRVPHHIPALMRLVEICVDGGLEATMHSAQAQLADAYLEIGSAAEARVIAEDLVAREPWERSNIERFRRALTLLGEADIDAIIADRLSGQSPFLSTDLMWSSDTPRVTQAAGTPAPPQAPAQAPPQQEGSAPRQQAPAPQPPVTPVADAARPPAAKTGASSHAIDLSGMFEDEERRPPAAPATAPARAEPAEVDLNDALHGINKDQAPAAGKPPQSLESVLKGVREVAVHEAASPEVAEQHFQLATSYIEMGMTDEAITALEVSARSIRHRFRAGALLAKLYMDKGDKEHSVEWFERAAEAPAPTPAAAHQLLYELATALEAQGESARALAVLLELQSEAGEYRDLAQRLEHLMGS